MSGSIMIICLYCSSGSSAAGGPCPSSLIRWVSLASDRIIMPSPSFFAAAPRLI